MKKIMQNIEEKKSNQHINEMKWNEFIINS